MSLSVFTDLFSPCLLSVIFRDFLLLFDFSHNRKDAVSFRIIFHEPGAQHHP